MTRAELLAAVAARHAETGTRPLFAMLHADDAAGLELQTPGTFNSRKTGTCIGALSGVQVYVDYDVPIGALRFE